MNTKLEQFPGTNPNPLISVEKNGMVIYSNEVGESLLHEWGVEVGEKLPSSVRELVQKIISRNSPEKIEVKVGKSIYLVVFHPLPEQECVSISGFYISDQKELEEKVQESDAREMAKVELSEIIGIKAIKPLMDDLYQLVHMPIGINDLGGNVLAGVGWQDICTKFHRVYPEAFKHCVESDTKLSSGVLPGEFKLYKCKNNMWDIVTPIIVCDQHVGYVFSGQFFFDDEPLDYELFRSQARKYGFNEQEYIAALEKVPRLSRETVNTGMSFFMTFANLLSQLSYSNIKLTKSLSERDTLLEALRKSESKYRHIIETAQEGVWVIDRDDRTVFVNQKVSEMLGYNIDEILGQSPQRFVAPEFCTVADDRLREHRQRVRKAIDYRFMRKDGSDLWCIVSTNQLFDDEGEYAGSLGMLTDITKRKEAEEALRLLNIYNRSLIEASLDPLVTIGHDGKIMDVNGATEEVTGYSRNDLIGTDFSDYFTEPKKARVGYEQVFTDGKVRDYPLEIQHKDGYITPVLYNASVYVDENGEVIGVFASARDITERKKAESKLKEIQENLERLVEERTAKLEKAYSSLKESEGRLAEAQRIAHIGNWDWNIITNGLYWSDEMYSIFGHKPKELEVTYDLFLNYVHPDDRDHVYNSMKNSINGEPVDIEYRVIIADGSERVVHGKAEVIFDENNIPIRLKGITQDITERKKAEEKLRENEEKYRNIVETANEGIALLDREGIITYLNNKMADMLGYSIGEMIGRPAWDFVAHEGVAISKSQIEKRRLGVSESYEIKLNRKDDSSLWVLINAKSIFDDDGKYIGSLSMHTDITKRKEAEKALNDIEIARKKEIHHRIKNNLQVISSLLDLQADKFKNRYNIKDYEVLEAFRESQDRVISMALIHEELYRGGGFETLNFSSYIENLAENLFATYRLGNTDISLKMDLVENAFFDMDTAVPLGIIVNELVSNSLKHAFSDRDKEEIRIKLHREESEDSKSTGFILTVSDNGIGIPENLEIEDLDSLGMQLVTTLIDQLDGELELNRDNGTEFTIRFTVAEDNNQTASCEFCRLS